MLSLKKQFEKKRYCLLTLFLAFLATPIEALAQPITFLFTGNVTVVDAALTGTFTTTQTLSAYYTFESTMPNIGCTNFFPTQACYGPLLAFTATVGNYTATLGTSLLPSRPVNSNIVLTNDPSCCDEYMLFASASGPNVNGIPPSGFAFSLLDSSRTMLDSLDLPLIPPGIPGVTSWSLNFGSSFIGGKITSLVEVRSVTIDIKPGSFPNSINLGSGGTVPVAIFSSPTFDAGTVDPLSITLGGAQVKLKGKGTPMASLEHVNNDGLADLIVPVSTEALQLSDGDSVAILTGQTYGGQQIQGSDSVRIVP